jgi:hypothetical protein
MLKLLVLICLSRAFVLLLETLLFLGGILVSEAQVHFSSCGLPASNLAQCLV